MKDEGSKVPEDAEQFVAPRTGGGADASIKSRFADTLKERERQIGAPSYSMRKVGSESDEGPLTVEQSLQNFEQLLKNSEKLVLATDLDGTVLPFAKNPLDCCIDPVAKEALARIVNLGIPLVVMTGRSGVDGAKMIEIPGAIIVGTAGWEVYRDGKSYVHERFNPYARELTDVLQAVRQSFFGKLTGSVVDAETGEPTSVVETPFGPVVLEKKAVNENFKEGLAQTYNLNQVDKSRWIELVAFARRVFEGFASDELKSVFKFDPPSASDLINNDTCDFSVSPFSGEGKEKSLMQLMRSDEDISPHTGEPKRAKYFRGIPGGFDGVVYFGDADQDAKAIRAANLTAALAGRQSAGVVVFKPELAGKSGQQQAIRNADVSTGGIEGNANLLSMIADLAEKHYRINR